MATTISKINTLYPLKYQAGGSFNVGIGFTVKLDPQPVPGFPEIYVEIQNGNDWKNFNASSGNNDISTVLLAKKDAQQTQLIPIKVIVWFTPSLPPGFKTKLAERIEFISVEKECVHDTEEILDVCLDGSTKKMRTCKFGNWVEEVFACPEDQLPPPSKSKGGAGFVIGGLSLWWLLLLLESGRRRD